MVALAYGVGDTIEYRPLTGGARRVLVEAVEPDIKNGRPGFEGKVVGDGLPVWGYDSQIVRVVSRVSDPIDAQRDALLELGFRQTHGFCYEHAVWPRFVEVIARPDGAWAVRAGPLGPRTVTDEARLLPGMSLRAFVAVVSSLLD